MSRTTGLQYLRTFPEPAGGFGKETPNRWAEYLLPVWGACLGLIIASLDHGFGYLFQNPLLSSVFTVALLSAASRRTYPAHFAQSSERLALLSVLGKTGNASSGYAGLVAMVLLLIVKIMALNALWLTLRWPVIALIPLASRWAMVVSMNLLPSGRVEASGPGPVHRRAIGPVAWATLLFAAVPLLYVYVSAQGFPLGDLGLDIAARIWVVAVFVALISSGRSLLRLGGWTAPRLGALAEMVEVAVPLAVILIIPR
jgi:adenosylcobinamide-GDP ribazoletransferase